MSSAADQLAHGALSEQALAWLQRVQAEDATGDDWSALTDWLEASPAHLAAFEAAERLTAEIEAARPQIAQALGSAPSQPTGGRSRWGVGLALAAGLAGLALAPTLWRGYFGTPETYRTEPGELRTLTLSDGTTVRMNGASRLTLRMGWGARRVEMADAEAAFDVTHDPRRPFRIQVGDEQVTVVGTAFNIRHAAHRTTVTVRRGVVEVARPGGVTRLTVGQSLTRADGQSGGELSRVDPDLAFGWTSGRLVYQDAPLSQVLEDLARRYPEPMEAGPALSGRRFTGVLELTRQDEVVHRLAGFLGVRAERRAGRIVLD